MLRSCAKSRRFPASLFPRHIMHPRTFPMTERSLKARLQRALRNAILALASAALLTFAMDYVVFRIRKAADRSAYGSVNVHHYYAVLQKNGKTVFTFDPPQAWTCVNSLFPHEGYLPCWYLRRHPEQRTDI